MKVIVTTEGGHVGSACVPSGVSTGAKEAFELRDLDPRRFQGHGVLKAKHHVEHDIYRRLKGFSVCDQQGIDQAMIELDGTPNKRRLGANAILGVSLAVAHAAAAVSGKPLFASLTPNPASWSIPKPLMNLINGGMHANNGLLFQEFMILPHKAPSFREALRWGSEVYHTLKIILKDRNLPISVGDEGGVAPPLQSDREALHLLLQAIEQAGYQPQDEISIALDVAASSWTTHAPSNLATSEQIIQHLAELTQEFPIISIEDGLDEEDWAGWTRLTQHLGNTIQIVGDDLFATQTQWLKKGIQERVANAILIKVNQVGTLSETIGTVKLAKAHQLTPIISHRSGETEDTTIADLAVALGAPQVKMGAPCRSERVCKYNRLLEIEAWVQRTLS